MPCRAINGHYECFNFVLLPPKALRLSRPINRPIQVGASCTVWTSGEGRFDSTFSFKKSVDGDINAHSRMHARALLVRDLASKTCKARRETCLRCRIAIPKFEVQCYRAPHTDGLKKISALSGYDSDSTYLYPMVLEVPVLEMLSLSLMSIMAAAADVVVGGSTSRPPLLQWRSACSGEKGNPACAVAFAEAGTGGEAVDDLEICNNECVSLVNLNRLTRE